MAKSIPQQLAEHIDSTCGLHVAQFFDEDGELRACQPGESVFAFTIACSLLIYEPPEHDSYLMNVDHMIQGDIDGLKVVQNSLNEFKMPEPQFQLGMKVFWNDPDENKCSGVYRIVSINEETYTLANGNGEVEVDWWRVTEIES